MYATLVYACVCLCVCVTHARLRMRVCLCVCVHKHVHVCMYAVLWSMCIRAKTSPSKKKKKKNLLCSKWLGLQPLSSERTLSTRRNVQAHRCDARYQGTCVLTLRTLQPDPPRNERGTRSGTGLGRRAQCSSGHGRTPNEYRKEEFGTVLGMVTHHHHTHASKEYRARRFGCIAPYHSTIPEHRTRALSVPDVT